jgi:hypothetical protein
MKPTPAPLLLLLVVLAAPVALRAQTPASPSNPPEAPQPVLSTRPTQTPAEAAEALRISKLAIINGRPYDQPSTRDTVLYYVHDTYGWGGVSTTMARTLYSEGLDKPTGWGQDWPGFVQRFGSAAGITIINGNVRLGMELLFREDLRFIPCHGCTARKKIENVLLAEITARHDENGHRFFTLTPTVADFSGPIIAHSLWYPKGFDPFAGVVATRLVFASRIGERLFQEFVWERRHHDPPFHGEPKRTTAAEQPEAAH